MENKNKKAAFIIIIILLLITLPLTVVGIYFSVNKASMENPNHEFKFENKLYFYTNSSKLVGTYECSNSNCDYANNTVTDNEFNIDYYKDDKNKIELIDNKYAFIIDSKSEIAPVNLYNVTNNKLLATYKSVKNYGIGINNNYFIVEAINGLYGVISINNDKIKVELPFNYEFIALQNELDETSKKIESDTFIVKQDGLWFLTDINSADLTNKTNNTIVSFDSTSYVTYSDAYSIFNNDGTSKIYGSFKSLNYLSNYLEVLDNNGNYYVYNLATSSIASKLYFVNETSVISTKINNEGLLEVIIDGETKEIVEIS